MKKTTSTIAAILGVLSLVPLFIFVYLAIRSATDPGDAGLSAGIFQLLVGSVIWLPFLVIGVYLFLGLRKKDPGVAMISSKQTPRSATRNLGYFLLACAAIVWTYCFYGIFRNEAGLEAVFFMLVFPLVALPLTIGGLVLIRK